MLNQYSWLSWGDYQQKGTSMKNTIRFDTYGNRLYKGEYQYKNHYKYVWKDEWGCKHHYCTITLNELRAFDAELCQELIKNFYRALDMLGQ